MILSAKAFFEDNTRPNQRLIIQSSTNLPKEWLKRYRRNVVKITPKKSGALRRSILTQAIGTQARVGWRAPYAAAQNQGSHTVRSKRVVNIDGNFVTLKPGVYRYAKYTTPGTGPRFGPRAFVATNAELPAIAREVGLTR